MDLLGLAAKMNFAAHSLQHTADFLDKAEFAALGTKIRDDVRSRHGFYQTGWASLSPYTIDKKGADTPLLEAGTLSDSYEAYVIEDPSGDGHAIIIGTEDETGLFHEFGYYNFRTGPVPARPVLLPAVMDHATEIQQVFGEALVRTFAEAPASRNFYRMQQQEEIK